MEVNLVTEALKFMMLGMGVVFTFLIIMIFVLKAQKVLLTRFFPEKEKNTKPKKALATNNTAKVAAIVAAVQHHKNLKR